MITRLRQSWQLLRESLRFVPGLLVLGSFGLAYGLVEFDKSTSFDGAKRFPLLFGTGADGARAMLSTIAGSMLTVTADLLADLIGHYAGQQSVLAPRAPQFCARPRQSGRDGLLRGRVCLLSDCAGYHSSIQTGTIVRHVFHETGKALDDLFPGRFGDPINDPAQAEAALRYSNEETGWPPVPTRQTGYL